MQIHRRLVMRHVVTFLAAALVVMTTQSMCAEAQSPATKDKGTAKAVRSIEGTTWAGTDSDGDYYEYTFLKGGQLRFKVDRAAGGSTLTYEDKGDVWAQNG